MLVTADLGGGGQSGRFVDARALKIRLGPPIAMISSPGPEKSGQIDPPAFDGLGVRADVGFEFGHGVAELGRLGALDGPQTDDPSWSTAEDLSLIGSTVGQYRVLELVGKGSMGRVFRAEHLRLQRPCALKFLDSRLVEKDPNFAERFWGEAAAAAHIVHPNVVAIYNVGSDKGRHFIEMEYVPGGSSLRERVIRSGPLSAELAALLVSQISEALHKAHSSGLVHRDVKPANVLLVSDRFAKLADFGLVHRVAEVGKRRFPVAGTPTYMAPELFRGQPASPRSDIYAVGVMLYYLLSARLPFAPDGISQLIRSHLTAMVPDVRDFVPGLPSELHEILSRCLAKRPRDRYASSEELANDLLRIVRRLRTTEALVRESIQGLDCFVLGGTESMSVVFELPGQRLQEVHVASEDRADGERLLSIFSVCAPASPEHYEFALRLNGSLNFGSLSIRNLKGDAVFVMNRTFVRDQASPKDVRDALLDIARQGDRVEQLLTGSDLH